MTTKLGLGSAYFLPQGNNVKQEKNLIGVIQQYNSTNSSNSKPLIVRLTRANRASKPNQFSVSFKTSKWSIIPKKVKLNIANGEITLATKQKLPTGVDLTNLTNLLKEIPNNFGFAGLNSVELN